MSIMSIAAFFIHILLAVCCLVALGWRSVNRRNRPWFFKVRRCPDGWYISDGCGRFVRDEEITTDGLTLYQDLAGEKRGAAKRKAYSVLNRVQPANRR